MDLLGVYRVHTPPNPGQGVSIFHDKVFDLSALKCSNLKYSNMIKLVN